MKHLREEMLYYENQFCIRAKDTRKTWSLINSLLNKTSHQLLSQVFNINHVPTLDNSLIVNAFNKYFVEIGTQLASKIPHHNPTSSQTHSTSIKESFQVTYAYPSEITN